MKKIRQLLIATNNAGKLKEFREILSKQFDSVLSPRDLNLQLDPEETGTTFEQNAAIKCDAFAKLLPDYYILADDSGLEVDALGGAPGVYSARYAGEHSTADECMQKLLTQLNDTEERTARFVTCLCLRAPDGKKIFAHGTVEGRIVRTPDGDNGFGYDPVFYCDALGKTFARADADEKNKISHRGRAIMDLTKKLNKF